VDAAAWVARVLLPLGVLSLLAGVAIWLALPLQWVNDGGWHLVIAIAAAVALLLPGIATLWVRWHLRDAVSHQEGVKRDVVRLLAASAHEGEIRARIDDALDRLRGPNKLRAIASVGRELFPLAKAARATHERYESLVEAFGPAGLGALWLAVWTNLLVLVAAPVAVIVGLVLFVL
jgi:hypothetical protein